MLLEIIVRKNEYHLGQPNWFCVIANLMGTCVRTHVLKKKNKENLVKLSFFSIRINVLTHNVRIVKTYIGYRAPGIILKK